LKPILILLQRGALAITMGSWNK